MFALIKSLLLSYLFDVSNYLKKISGFTIICSEVTNVDLIFCNIFGI